MTRKILLIVVCLLVISLAMVGCSVRRGDFKLSPVFKGQIAPHEGYNIGPELYLETGDIVIVDGAILYLKHTEPNDIAGMLE